MADRSQGQLVKTISSCILSLGTAFELQLFARHPSALIILKELCMLSLGIVSWGGGGLCLSLGLSPKGRVTLCFALPGTHSVWLAGFVLNLCLMSPCIGCCSSPALLFLFISSSSSSSSSSASSPPLPCRSRAPAGAAPHLGHDAASRH